MSKDGNRVMLGGLWLNTSRSGEKYMSGRLGLGGKILVFRNKGKEKDSNEPDYYLMLAEWERSAGEDGEDGEHEIPF